MKKYMLLTYSLLCLIVIACLEWHLLVDGARGSKSSVVVDPRMLVIELGFGNQVSYQNVVIGIILLCFVIALVLSLRVRDSWHPLILYQAMILGVVVILLAIKFFSYYDILY